MTANQMRYELLLLLDNLIEWGAPAYDDRQISTLLTKAQQDVFRNKYGRNVKKAFESSEDRRRELEQLIKSAEYDSTDIPGSTITVSASQTGVHPSGVFFDLPSDFQYAIEESVVINATTGNEITVQPITHDQYIANVYNPYQNPYDWVAWRMDISKETPTGEKRTEIITDGSTILNYRVRYLRTLPSIVADSVNTGNQVDCILDDSIHSEIVDKAYSMAVASIKPDEIQIAVSQQKDREN